MKLIKKIARASAVLALASVLAACSNESDSSSEESISPIVVTPTSIALNITFDANGGSITTATFSDEKEYGWFSLPSAEELGLSRTAYTFLGWAKTADATNADYSDGQKNIRFTENTALTLYAVWKQGYAATTSTVCDVIRALTADATVVVTGSLPGYDAWDAIAAALADVPDVNVTLDFSEIAGTSNSLWGYQPFKDTTNLVAVVLPTGYAYGADFSGCKSLASISISENSESYASVDGVLYDKDVTNLILYPAGKTATSFTVPDTVTTISGSAFCKNTYLTSVITPDCIDTIKSFAFSGMTSLTEVTLGESLTTIEAYAFSGCSALTTAKFNNTSCLWIIAKSRTSETPETTSCTVNDAPRTAAQWLTKTFGDYAYYNYYWLSPYGSITFDANGGSMTATETTQRYKYSMSVQLKTAEELGLTREGYTFKGWATTADATSASSYYWCEYSADGDYDVTLYAVWEAE